MLLSAEVSNRLASETNSGPLNATQPGGNVLVRADDKVGRSIQNLEE